MKHLEAAKETAELIALSTKNTETGANIAKITAESFSQIVRELNINREIIAKIAQHSQKQHASVSLMNKEVETVSSVVRQTAVESEGTAEIAEKMNSKAVLLKELAEDFKIRENLSAGSIGNVRSHGSVRNHESIRNLGNVRSIGNVTGRIGNFGNAQ